MQTVRTVAGGDMAQEADLALTVSIRRLTILRAYNLRERFDKARTAEERQSIRQEWALESGRDPGALDNDLRWTERIRERDLKDAFAAEWISEDEWQARIGPEHLKALSYAKNQTTHQLLPSAELAQMAVEVYHQNLDVDGVYQLLRVKGLLAPRTGKMAPPVPKGNVKATTFLRWLADHLEETGRDFDMTHLLRAFDLTMKRDLPFWIRRLADLWEKVGPKTMYSPKEGTR